MSFSLLPSSVCSKIIRNDQTADFEQLQQQQQQAVFLSLLIIFFISYRPFKETPLLYNHCLIVPMDFLPFNQRTRTHKPIFQKMSPSLWLIRK